MQSFMSKPRGKHLKSNRKAGKSEKKIEPSAEIIDSMSEGMQGIPNQSGPQQFKIFQDRVVPADLDTKTITMDQLNKFPLINDTLANGVLGDSFGNTPQVSKKTLMNYAISTPEIVSTFNALTEDVISDGFNLYIAPEDMDKGTNGKNRKRAARKFLKENFFKETLVSLLWDVFATGDGYLFMNKVSQQMVSEAVTKTMQIFKVETKTMFHNETRMHGMLMKSIDEDAFGLRSFSTVASTTVTMKYSNRSGGVTEYIQRVGADTRVYTPEQIAHLRLWRVDGKVYGFTPLQAIFNELDILANIKDLARYYFQKGGVPNYMFILKNESADSPTYKKFRKTIKEFQTLWNKYKNIVVAGDVEAKELNRLDKDMEFRELAKYMTQIIVMAFGMPSSRLSDTLVEKGSRGTTIASEGYYRKVSYIQDMVEDFVDENMLKRFRVRIRFNRSYKQDEVREMTVEKIKTDIAEQRLTLGLWDREAAWEWINTPEEVRERIIKEIPKDQWIKRANMAANPDEFGSSRRGEEGGTRQQGNDKITNFKANTDGETQAQANDKKKAASDVKTQNTKAYGSVDFKDLEKYKRIED